MYYIQIMQLKYQEAQGAGESTFLLLKQHLKKGEMHLKL